VQPQDNFPSLIFDLIPHLLMHIVHEMKYMGHVFLHQMYPFERFMTVLKKYVHNRNCLKGCMVQGCAIEEVIEFAVHYMDLQAIGQLISRHEGHLSGKGTRGRLCHIHPSTFHSSTIIYSNRSLCQHACPNIMIQ
jgi:hypothetical protein